MLHNFRTYKIAVEFYRLVKPLSLPSHLKDQLDRASSSIVLNIAEGSGRKHGKDTTRFFQMALGSLREVQAIMDLSEPNECMLEAADKLGAHLYRLIYKRC